MHYKHALIVVLAAVLLLSALAVAAPGGEKGKPPETPGGKKDKKAPSDPTDLVATGLVEAIHLYWTPSTDNVGVTGYEVFRRLSGMQDFYYLATAGTNVFLDSPLPPLVTYDYKVRAFDAAGNYSGFSNIASATTLEDSNTM